MTHGKTAEARKRFEVVFMIFMIVKEISERHYTYYSEGMKKEL
jgi:hypothetical protein